MVGKHGGGGRWTTPQGASGNWTGNMVVKEGDGEKITIEEDLVIFAPEGGEMRKEHTVWTGVMTDGGFFDLFVEERKVGWGFCGGNVCSIVVRGKNDRKEASLYGETFEISKKGISRIGHKSAGDEIFAWTGLLQTR